MKILADVFLCPKRHFYLFRKQNALIKKARDDISLTENLKPLLYLYVKHVRIVHENFSIFIIKISKVRVVHF